MNLQDLLNDVQLERCLETLDPRTGRMLHDVMQAVHKGTTLGHAADQWQRGVNYVMVHKRQAALAAAGLGATAAVSGGVAVPFALAGQALPWAGSALWHALRVAGKRHAHARGGVPMLLPDGSLDPEYRKSTFDAVRYILKHQGLTDLYNAFDRLQHDHDALLHHGLLTMRPRPGAEHELRLAMQQGAVPHSCTEAIGLLELLYRVRERYVKVAETGDLLEEFMTCATLIVSRFDARGVPIVRSLWRSVLGLYEREIHDAERPEALYGVAQNVMDLFNRVVNRAGVQRHIGRLALKREKDYQSWVANILFSRDFGDEGDYDPTSGYDETLVTPDLKTALVLTASPRARAAARDVARAIHRRLDEVGLRDLLGELASSVAEDYVGMSPSTHHHGDKRPTNVWRLLTGSQRELLSVLRQRENAEELAQFVLGKGVDATLGMLETLAEKAVKGSAEDTLGKAALKGSFGHFFDLQTLVTAPALVLTGVIAEIANNWLNEKQFETRRTSPVLGRPQTLAERISTLRTLAKEEIDEYAEVIDDWAEVHDRLGAGDGAQGGPARLPAELAAELLLRYKLCERRFYHLRCGWLLQETVVHASRQFRDVAEGLFPEALEAVNTFVKGQGHSAAGLGPAPCQPYCYCRAGGRPIVAHAVDRAAPAHRPLLHR